MSWRWLSSRIGRSAVTLWLLMSFTFVALNMSSEPALQILGPEAGPEAVAAFNQAWGLDRPLWEQYLRHLGRLSMLDFGLSYRTRDPAVEMVIARIPATLSLMLPTAALAVAIGVPLGVLAAIRKDGLVDRTAMAFAVVGFAVPNFLVGILLIYLFSVHLGWLQPAGIVTWKSWIMPVLTMASAEAAVFARFSRSAMVEVLGHPMMRTALANGIPWGQAVRQHALPNAAVPIVTVAGLFFGSLIGGGGDHRERLCVARARAAVGRCGAGARLCHCAMRGPADRLDHDPCQSHRRPGLWLDRPTHQGSAAMSAGNILDFRRATGVMGRAGRGTPISVWLSAGVLILLVLITLTAQWLQPYALDQQNLLNRYAPPVFIGGTWAHPLGTDALGQDMLSLMLRAIQVSMAIAFAGTVIGAAAGTLIGFAAAHFGGWVDSAVGVAVDFQAALPFLVLALALLAVLPDADIGTFIILMCIYGWERYARLARGLAISAREQGWATAQTALGAGPFRLYFRHVLPNIAAVLVVNMSLNFPATILTETSLNFLGIGIEPPDTSLGVLMGQGRSYLYKAPWIALMPGLVIFAATFAMSILGDRLRDRLDVAGN